MAEAALLEFQASSVRRPTAVTAEPYTEEDHLPPRRQTWAERAREELEVAMELDLEPDRQARRKRVPSYERVIDHLRSRGY